MIERTSTARRFGRAMLLRCPRCGSPGILATWFRMKDRCPRCTLALDRGEQPDFWLGAYAINLVVAESLAAIIALAVLWAEWPESGPAQATGMVLVIALPIVFYPFSRALWLAWDLTFRPKEEGD